MADGCLTDMCCTPPKRGARKMSNVVSVVTGDSVRTRNKPCIDASLGVSTRLTSETIQAGPNRSFKGVRSYSLLSGTCSAAAWKPIFECVPSQNGFLLEAPQRHRENGGGGVSTLRSS